MERKTALWLLTGIMVGIITGVELVGYASARACPSSACLESTQVIPISDRGYYPEVNKALQNARDSIHMVQFELKYYEKYPGSSATQLVNDLIAAKKRGVDVKVVVDDFSNVSNAFDILRENGIEVRMDPKNITTHAKLVIVDGRVVVLGSTNLSYYGLEMNNEIDVMLISEQAAEYYEKYFWNLWNQN